MKGRVLGDLSRGRNNKWRCTFEFDDDPRSALDTLADCDLEITVKKYRAKRSLDANAYMWQLLDKIADAIHDTKEHIYLDYVRRVGLFRDWTLTQEEAKTFRTAWEMLGTGWPTEQVDYAPDGEHVVIRAYYGSSTYNTRQMSRLIDAVVQDCKQLGIETLPPEKLAAMKEQYNGK